MTNSQNHGFDGYSELLDTANEHLPVADEKPLYTEKGASDDGPPIMARHPDDRNVFLTDVGTHKVIYNPDTGTTFGVVSDEYEIINPPQIFGPLAQELDERDRDIQGNFTVYEDGARGYGEILFTDTSIWPEDRNGRSSPVRTGITARWSHDGGVSVRASAFAQDGQCKNTMRQVADSVYVKHAGDVSERVDFREEWARVLDGLGAFSEALETVIDGAMSFDIMTFEDGHDELITDDWLAASEALEALGGMDVPSHLDERARDGINGLFNLIGFPRYLAMAATDRALWRLVNSDHPYRLTAWDAYSAATYALTHESRFDTGSSSDDEYHRLASDLLSNPELAIQTAQNEAQNRVAPPEDQATLSVEDNTGDAMRAFKERERAMREALADGE